jgi:choline dehydrogenase-like flavoprotein
MKVHPAETGAAALDDRRADVLIVGAGASGAVAASRLVEAGYRVVCLEQGPWPDRSSFPGATDEWELAGRQMWSGEPGVRRAPADYPIDLSDSDVGVLNYNGVGGGTVLYAAQWARLLPSDFTRRTDEGVAEDWPLTYAELLPFYERTDRQFGVSGLGGDPAFPDGADPPLPPLPIGAGALRVARAHARLGWHWWPAANAILSAPWSGRHPCVQRATCTLGCNEGAKGSTDLTHWPAFVAAGGRLITDASVVAIPTDGRGLATGAEWVDGEGKAHFQAADVVLLAANGIGTPRLLLASASSRAPDGLANSSGLVGRGLMVHPLALAKGFFHQDLESWRGHFGGSIVSYEFYASDERRGFVGGAKWAMVPTGGPLQAALSDGGVWGEGHHRHVRDRFGCSAHWGLVCEDLPDPANRVDLSPTLTDRCGLAAPRITYRISDNTRALCEWHLDKTQESLAEAGAWHTEVASGYPPNGHFMGTARMGDDPNRSVVDRWSMAHAVPNLGVIDGSTFVTSGGVNPTSSISALALRAVEHLIAHRGNVPTPEQRRSVHFGDTTASASPKGRPVSLGRPAVDPAALDESVRFQLARVAQILIPAGDTMPSADEVGVSHALLDRVVAAVPSLAHALAAALPSDIPEEDIGAWLNRLSGRDPAGYDSLVLAVAGAYYLDPGVRRRLGYEGQVPRPVVASAYPEYVDEGLLDAVLSNWAESPGRVRTATLPRPGTG